MVGNAKAVETWSVLKPAVVSQSGMVASQHFRASEVGAQVLQQGGNAVDAAVATSFAIGTQEPWMSGLGGGGFMLVYSAKQRRAQAIDFGMKAAQALDPKDYPVNAGHGSDLFNWPAVLEDRNLKGYYSMALPGQVAGMALALETFGSRTWQETLAPAIELARAGLPIDWYATLKIAAAAHDLNQYPESQRVYLPNGFAPAAEWAGALPKIHLRKLADTLSQLAEAGPRDFYQGALASALLADLQAGGSKLAAADFAAYKARLLAVEPVVYRNSKVYAAPGLTAGPTLQRALQLLQERLPVSEQPETEAFTAYAQILQQAYAERLATMGDSSHNEPSCTTHISVVDKEGNLVALTQTLLSVFGSKTVLPQTGILMNNGIMWFDPRPGRPNSIAAGKRPLSNMCPTIVERHDGFRFAIGASGGRRIMPAVYQLISFLTDYGMDMNTAFHHPRLDVSGTDVVTVDNALDASIIAALADRYQTDIVQNSVYPAYFACPNAVGHDPMTGANSGCAFIMSPWAKVASY